MQHVTTVAACTPEQDTLIREHVQLVHYVVAEVAQRLPGHVARNDLVSAGMLGLVQAARSFDPQRGIAFERFASTRIRGALLDELRGRDWASRSVRARARAVNEATDRLTSRLGRAPSAEELGDELGVAAHQVRRVNEDVHRAAVINYESLAEDGDPEAFLPIEAEGPEDVALEVERRAYLADAVNALPDRLRVVVVAYFFEERTMQDIADELGVSESRISQLRTEALALLKDGMNSQLTPEAVSVPALPKGRAAKRRRAYYDDVERRARSRRPAVFAD